MPKVRKTTLVSSRIVKSGDKNITISVGIYVVLQMVQKSGQSIVPQMAQKSGQSVVPQMVQKSGQSVVLQMVQRLRRA